MSRSKKEFIPVMLMPFQEDLSIDYKALDELIDFYLNAGAKGLFANCLSSEMFQLSKEEMIKSVSHIVKRVNGRVPIVATGTFKESLEDQASFIKEIYKTGINAVILITGLLAEETDSDEVFEGNVRKLLSLTDDVPVGFYECPVPYKRVIEASFLGELANSGRLKYHKDTSLSIDSIHAKIAATKDNEEFGLYDAYMAHAVDTLKAGSAGLSCIQGNFFPELVVWLCDNYNNDDLKDLVDKVQKFYIDNMDVMHYAYPTAAKFVLNQMGMSIKVEVRRNDIEELDENSKHKLQILIQDYESLKSELAF